MMQKFTQKYTLVQFFEDIPEGTQFPSSSWPLHSTIVDTFAIDWDVPTILKNLQELLTPHKGAAITVGEDEFFGPEKQTQVVLLQKTKDLVQLHLDVLERLEQGKLKLNDPQFAHRGFLPHSTVQKHARLNKGDVVTISALSLIDMFPNEDPYVRKVLGTVKLG